MDPAVPAGGLDTLAAGTKTVPAGSDHSGKPSPEGGGAIGGAEGSVVSNHQAPGDL